MQDDPIARNSPEDGDTSEEGEESDGDSALIYVPTNPLEWTTEHIQSWVRWLSKKFQIFPPLEPVRFPTSGADLAKFTKADFWVCAGSKAGGNALARHYAHLRQIGSGGGVEDSTLANDVDPGNNPLAVLSPSPAKILINDQRTLLASVTLVSLSVSKPGRCEWLPNPVRKWG